MCRVGNVLKPFQLRTTNIGSEGGGDDDFAYVHFMEVTKPMLDLEKALVFVFLRPPSWDEIHRTLDIAHFVGQDNNFDY